MGIIGAGSVSYSPGLALETAKRSPIPNGEGGELDEQEVRTFHGMWQHFTNVATLRHGPTQRYNCHGATFASRRTGIWDDALIFRILSEDDYKEVPTDDVRPGDTIVYFNDINAPVHSGLVIQRPTQATFYIPLVCSKWGRYGEYVHEGDKSPYGFNVRYYRVRV